MVIEGRAIGTIDLARRHTNPVTPRPRPIVLKIGRPHLFAEIENSMAGWTSIAATMEGAVRELACGDYPDGARPGDAPPIDGGTKMQ